jgi:hypothetical protein
MDQPRHTLTHQLTLAAMFVSLHLVLSSWFLLAPGVSYFVSFLLPLFGIYLIYHRHGVAYWFYASVAIIIQLLIIPLPLDWVLIIILPNVIAGGFLGWLLLKKMSFVFLVSFATYGYFLLFLLSDTLTRWLYDLSWQQLFVSIFSINLNASMMVLWLSAIALFQFLLVWFALVPFLQRFRIQHTTSLRLDDPTRVLFLSLLVTYLIFIILSPSLASYVFAPLLLLTVYQIVLKIIVPWRVTTWFYVLSIVVFPVVFFALSPLLQAIYHLHIWVYIPLLISSDSIQKVVHLIHKNSAKLKA